MFCFFCFFQTRLTTSVTHTYTFTCLEFPPYLRKSRQKVYPQVSAHVRLCPDNLLWTPSVVASKVFMSVCMCVDSYNWLVKQPLQLVLKTGRQMQFMLSFVYFSHFPPPASCAAAQLISGVLVWPLNGMYVCMYKSVLSKYLFAALPLSAPAPKSEPLLFPLELVCLPLKWLWLRGRT